MSNQLGDRRGGFAKIETRSAKMEEQIPIFIKTWFVIAWHETPIHPRSYASESEGAGVTLNILDAELQWRHRLTSRVNPASKNLTICHNG